MEALLITRKPNSLQHGQEEKRWGKAPWQDFQYTNMPWPENNKANDILTRKCIQQQSSDAVSPEDASREQNWCIVWRVRRRSEVQGSVESREACITPSEVDKAHQWPIYSTVQYQASSPPANAQWQHEQVLVSFSFMPIKTKLACSFKNFLSWEEVGNPSLPFQSSVAT